MNESDSAPAPDQLAQNSGIQESRDRLASKHDCLIIALHSPLHTPATIYFFFFFFFFFFRYISQLKWHEEESGDPHKIINRRNRILRYS